MTHIKIIFAISFMTLAFHPCIGSLFPEDYDFIEEDELLLQGDFKLNQWIQKYDISINKYDGNLNKFLTSIGETDSVTQAYAALLFSKSNPSSKEYKGLIKVYSDLFLKHQDSLRLNHPLYPYLLEAYQNYNFIQKDYKYFIDISNGPSGMNCPSFKYIHNKLTDRTYINNSTTTKGFLSYLLNSNRKKHVQLILNQFLYRLPKSKTAEYAPYIKPFYNKFSNLNLSTQISDSTIAQKKYNEIKKFIKKKHCITAKSRLIKFLNSKNEQMEFDKMTEVIHAISQCFKRRSPYQSIKFLNVVQNKIEKIYGFPGLFEIKFDMAKINWNIDKNTKALNILAELSHNSELKKDPERKARLLLFNAQIFDNQQLYEQSIPLFKKFIKLFPDHPSLQEAHSSLILAYVEKRDWQNILKTIQNIDILEAIDIGDDSSERSLGFFLFWAGRSAIELGMTEKGIDYWKLAFQNEFSSYYGALSHYMLEKFTGKKYALYPIYGQSFDYSKLLNSPDPVVQRRLKRILLLLRLGLKKQSLCEIEELPNSKSHASRTLKSLLLHASGKWLDSIKVYGDLPRSYRKTLPRGMEKLLFPKKYDQKVKYYSKKAGIDPALIFSIIRQESAFNPRAYSGSGAKGLMQIMNRTARTVAQKLPRNYISKKQKSYLIRKSRKPSSLYDIETNIILGVHYISKLSNRYKNLPEYLAAYNAGPSHIKKWLQRFPTSDPLYFIERIPFKETREYVKLVIRNYFYYKKWYQPTEKYSHLDNLTQYLIAKEQHLPRKYQKN